MYAIEFRTAVKEDGSIDIPEEYRQQVKGTVRVIILTLEPARKTSIIQDLLNNPRKVTDATPMRRDDIYDRSL